MDVEILKLAKELSKKVIVEAGQLAKNHFDKLETFEEKDKYGDVVTEVDLLAEEMIIEAITKVFKDHQIEGEETGRSHHISDWLWMVDPLDGTNNFVMGLPIFSTSITLMYKQEPILGVIYEAMTNRLYVTSRNGGSFCNGKAMSVISKENIRRSSVGWIQGHNVQNDPRAVSLRQYIDIHFRRMIRLWAPTLQWCMLAKGDLGGIILYNSEGDDLYSGILMVKEAGGVVVDFEGNSFSGMCNEPYLVACHPDNKDYFLQLVQKGLAYSKRTTDII